MFSQGLIDIFTFNQEVVQSIVRGVSTLGGTNKLEKNVFQPTAIYK